MIAPRGLLRPAIRCANVILARKPRFVVIAVPRSGTRYFAELCRANGVICAHEGYFTKHGPMLRNPDRRFDAVGDVSWLAPPFLPMEGMVVVHQVRHPMKVIRSIYEMGLFDPAREHTRAPFVAMARRYFRFSEDPLHSALRFYIEWNERCEQITEKRYKIEEISNEIEHISKWLGNNLRFIDDVSKTTNSRDKEVSVDFKEQSLKYFPEYSKLQLLSDRYGYSI